VSGNILKSDLLHTFYVVFSGESRCCNGIFTNALLHRC